MTNAPNSADGTAPPERKPLQTFALHVCFLTLLFWVVPSFDSVYAYGFKAGGNTAFGNLGGNLRIEYSWVPPSERNSPGEIEMVGRVIGIDRLAWESTYSVRTLGYEPSAMLLALMLATPMSRRRRVASAVGGLTALNLFILSQTALLGLASFAAADATLVVGGEYLGGTVRIVEAVFRQPIPRYAAVFAVWALLAAPTRGLDLQFGALGKRVRDLLAAAGKKSSGS